MSAKVQAFRRNWQVAAAGVVLSAGSVGAAMSLVPPTYTASSQMVLLPPHVRQKVNDNDVVNPYMSLGGMVSMADLVSRAITDDKANRELQKAGVSQYTVQWDPTAAGPILLVQATGSSPAEARQSLAVLSRQIPVTLVQLQTATSTDPAYFITATVVSGPNEPRRSTKTQLRAVGVAGVAGLTVTVLAVSTVDSWRRRRRGGPPPTGSRPAPADPPLPGAAPRTPPAGLARTAPAPERNHSPQTTPS